MLFRARHDILALPQIPRERAVLQTMLTQARRHRRISRLKRWAAYNCIVWALIILLIWMPLHSAPPRVPPAPPPHPTQQHPISSSRF